MSDSQAQATFQVSVEGNASSAAKDIASSSREAYRAITEYESEVKALSSDLRRLRGNSEEVAAAKKQIRERVEQARSAVSNLSTALIKSGSSYAQAGAAARAASEAERAAGEVAKAAGEAAKKAGEQKAKAAEEAAKKAAEALKVEGEAAKKAKAEAAKKAKGDEKDGKKKEVDETGRLKTALGLLSPKLSAAHSLMGDLSKVAGEGATSMQAGRVAALGAAGAVTLVAVAAVAAVASIVAVTASLIKFALVSSDAAAKAQRHRQALLGNAADAKALGTQIDALAGKVGAPKDEIQALGLELSRTRLTGTAMVDTLNAVAQASGAAGASSGAKLQEIITRGQDMGRMFIGLRELQGTGLDFDDVAKEYAKGQKKSIEAARAELTQGKASIGAGAAAIRAAAEKKFAGMNLEDAFSLENGPKKLAEQFAKLSSGVDMKPVSKQFQNLFEQLDPSAPLGSAIKSMMTTLGDGFVFVATRAIPAVVEGFKWLVVGGLQVMTAFYQVRNAVREAFNADTLTGAGAALVDGLVKGIKTGFAAVYSTTRGLASAASMGLTDKLQIKSPSRLFEDHGVNTTEGYAQGVEKGQARAQGAVASMVAVPANGNAGGAPSASGGGGDVHIHIHAGGADAKDLQSPSFFSEITKAVRAARMSQGAMVAA